MNLFCELLVFLFILRLVVIVMLVCDLDVGLVFGLVVFLMWWYVVMDFVVGVMVFFGGGVDDCDCDVDLGWLGVWVGLLLQWWVQWFGIEFDFVEVLVCVVVCEMFEELGVLFVGLVDQDYLVLNSIVLDVLVYGDVCCVLVDWMLFFVDFLQWEKLVL